jgi:hypothetical protein
MHRVVWLFVAVALWFKNFLCCSNGRFFLLKQVTKAEGLPDSSEKPAEALCCGSSPFWGLGGCGGLAADGRNPGCYLHCGREPQNFFW